MIYKIIHQIALFTRIFMCKNIQVLFVYPIINIFFEFFIINWINFFCIIVKMNDELLFLYWSAKKTEKIHNFLHDKILSL